MMTNKNTAVMGIFAGAAAVENAIERLKEAGFRHDDISVLMAENTGSKDFAHHKDTKAPEGTAVGASAGAVIGGSIGWLAGIGALTVTGLGALVAAGPVVAMLAGIGVGGALGGISGALIGLGIPEYEARRFEGMIKEGKALLSVHCDGHARVARAKDVLARAGGTSIAARGEAPVTRHEADVAAPPHGRPGGGKPLAVPPPV